MLSLCSSVLVTAVAKEVARYRLGLVFFSGGYVGQVGHYKCMGFYFLYGKVLNLQ